MSSKSDEITSKFHVCISFDNKTRKKKLTSNNKHFKTWMYLGEQSNKCKSKK